MRNVLNFRENWKKKQSKVNIVMENNYLIFDIYWTFVLPSICVFSFLTNVFNVIITYVLRKKSVVYKYMFLNSVTNLAYLFIMFFVFLIKCGQLCDDLKDSYIAKFYHHYFFFFKLTQISKKCSICVKNQHWFGAK